MASSKPYSSAGAASKHMDKKDFYKKKGQQRKVAEKSVFKLDINDRGKKLVIYELGGDRFIDVYDEELDGSSSPNKRATMPYDVIFSLTTLFPSVIANLKNGQLEEDRLLDPKTDLYLILSKLTPHSRLHQAPRPRFYANIRHKYRTDDGVMGVVGFFILFLFHKN